MAAHRAAIVGTGHRARLYTRTFAQRDGYDLVALCDPSPTRMAVHNRILTEEHDRPAATTWSPGDFAEMLDTHGVDTLVVSTVDALHDAYIVPALRTGCRVITEKPMTIDAERCRRVLDAVDHSTGELIVAFNYRFNPVHGAVHDLLADRAIGEVLSVHFEWLLDVHHGADYFRRWHRERANSGGLMVHKASHHFDLVNWWLQAVPSTVYGVGRRAFYGQDAAGVRQGFGREYDRAHNAADADHDPFALDLEHDPVLRALYLDAEPDNGYIRDQNVFTSGIDIEDDMAVLVTYDTGATLTYHLTAYAPWEGYRIAFNGSRGRLELDVQESTWADGERLPGAGPTLVLRELWKPPVEIPLAYDSEGHGGGDSRMLAAILDDGSADAPLANARDGALALLVGHAANTSFATGAPVDIAGSMSTA